MTNKADNGFRVGPAADPDRYVLGPAVASGAEGILYRGSITVTGFELPVAIKMLQPRFHTRLNEWHARWSEQVELLRSLQVPGVVRVRDGFLGPLPHLADEAGESTTLYLVMNWVEGEPLDEWVRTRPDRDPFDTLKLLLGVAAALDMMHSGAATGGVPVVHRDVKPANILVTDEGTVLVDFGLTRGLPEGQRLSGVTGTRGYLPPEATEAGVYTPATDRYAFGGVAYFVLTGTEPPETYQADTLRTLLTAVPALARRPEAVDHLMAMLDADPTARPPALANWVAQLRRSSLSGLPEVLAPEAPGRNPQPASLRPSGRRAQQVRSRRHTVAAVAAVSAILAVAGMAVGTDSNDGRSGERASGAIPVMDGSQEESHSLPNAGAHESLRSSSPPISLPTIGRWRAIDPGPLATRGEPKAAWTGKEVLVVGGLLTGQSQALSDGAAFDLATGKWRMIPPRPLPGRVMHAVWTGDELFTFATEGSGLEELATAAAFNPTTNRWREVSLPPSSRLPQEVVWTGRQVLVWQPGGASPGALYDPAQDRWTPIPADSASGFSEASHAVWTGEELAAEGSVMPANGGPAEQRLVLFNPNRNAWRVSARPPGVVHGWPLRELLWTGREVVLTSEGVAGAAATYAYDPSVDGWRSIANPDISVPPTGYFEGVRLDDGRVVVRVGSADDPLQILEPASGTWSTSGPPPGRLPTPDGALVSTGSSVFHWGNGDTDGFVDSQAPNAAWLWSP